MVLGNLLAGAALRRISQINSESHLCMIVNCDLFLQPNEYLYEEYIPTLRITLLCIVYDEIDGRTC